MSVILEGPDNAGKTTLAKDLQKMVNVAYHHPGGRPELGQIPTMLAEQYLLAKRKDVIVDRITCLSDQVYRPGMMLDPQYMSMLRSMLKLENCVIVYCKPSTDAIVSKESIRFRDSEDDEVRGRILENLHAYVNAYEVVMAKIPHILYDYTDELSAGWTRKYVTDAYRTQDFSKLRRMAENMVTA